MKTKFEKPELLIILFDSNDIIVTSGDYGDGFGDWVDPADPDPEP